jgi:uncharacterized protein involved in outer membrane biogenesis
MKTFFKILVGFFVVIITLLTIAPIFLKDKIADFVRQQINNQVEAKVDFGRVQLSFIRNFPNVYFAVNDFSVFGVNQFEGVPLTIIEKLELKLDLLETIKGNYHINELTLVEPLVNVLILEDGSANYDIAKASESENISDEPKTDAADDSDFRFNLKSYKIIDGSILYEDRTFPMLMKLAHLDHSGSGDFTLSQYLLNTETSIKQVSFKYDGTYFLKNAPFDLKAVLNIDMDNMHFAFVENSGSIQNLPLNFDGYVAMPTDDIKMDIKFNSPGTTFKDLLGFVPAEYLVDIETAQVNGDLVFSGSVFGVYNEENMPGFSLKAEAKNGYVKYPDLPHAVEKVAIDLKIESEGGADYDNTIINLKRFYLEVDKNPIEANLLLKTPISDPDLKTDIAANFDFSKVRQAIPLGEEVELTGIIDGEVHLAGKMSAIEQERYQDFLAKGTLALKAFKFNSPDTKNEVNIPQALLTFHPKFIELKPFELIYGKSDLAFTGRLENYLAYALKNETLAGNFNLNSKLIDANELMAEVATDDEEAVGSPETINPTSETTEEVPEGVVKIPGNLDVVFTANVAQMLYEEHDMRNLNGKITIKNHEARLEKFSLEMLGGSVLTSGSYQTKPNEKPAFDFFFDIKNFDIKKTAESFVTVDKMIPLAKSSTGFFSTGLKLKANLAEDMTPVYNTLNGGGNLRTNNLKVGQFEALQRIDERFKLNKLKGENIDDIRVSFDIINGKMYLKPFDVKIDDVTAVVSGDFTIETQEMDMVMETSIPTKTLGREANQLLGSALQQAGNLGLNLSSANAIPVSVTIKGTYENPNYGFKVGNPVSTGGSTVKDQVKQQLDDKLNEAKKQAEEELQRQREEAERRAREEADRLKREAEERAQKEADELKRKAEEEAKRRLRNLFK